MANIGCTQGGGQHLAKLAETDPALTGLTRWMQSLIAVECLWCVCLSSIKISFLVFYRRTFPGKWFARITHITTVVIILWALAYFWLSIFNCDPVYASWTLSLLTTTAKCITSKYFYIGIWLPHITTDVVTICLPQWKVWQLHVGLKQKILLALLFLLGGVNVIASGIRFATTFRVSWADPTWTTASLAVWTCIEVLAAVASACLPLMRPLYHKVTLALCKVTTNSTKRNASRIWYTTNRGGRLREVNLLASSSGHFADDAYATPPGEEAPQSFAIAVAPVQGDPKASTVQGEGFGDNNKRILVTRSWDIQY